MSLTFEWDKVKAKVNKDKHSVDFEEAQSVFSDIFACIFNDEWHSSVHEYRELIIGHSTNNRMLLVSFVERKKETIRIISARLATKNEIRKYENENPFRKRYAPRI